MNMETAFFANQVFTEKVEISEGILTFENCVFEKGLCIKGDNRLYFLKGEGVHAIFKFCTFRSQDKKPCVMLCNRAHGEFYDCQMISENDAYYHIQFDTCFCIDIGSQGVFQRCSISYFGTCAGLIMIGSSGLFEDCCFRCVRNDEREFPVVPIYFDACDKDRTRFSKCLFWTNYDLKEADSFFLRHGSSVKIDNCRFNTMVGENPPSVKNCSFEPNASEDDFKIEWCGNGQTRDALTSKKSTAKVNIKVQDLIGFFKYYKNEDENPFGGKNKNASIWWVCEKQLFNILMCIPEYWSELEEAYDKSLLNGYCSGVLADLNVQKEKRIILFFLNLWHTKWSHRDTLNIFKDY